MASKMHKAVAEIETDNPKLLMEALKPDMSPSPKFEASLNAAGRKLVLTVEAPELGGLAAGLTSWLRLIKAAKEASEIK